MESEFTELPIEQVHRNPKQPRQHFDEAELNELADTIKADGLLVPILVRPDEDGYEIVHGERRWRASLIAGLTTIKSEVRDISPDEAYTLSVIENEQRVGLSPIETATALKAMMDSQKLTPSGVARRIGKSRDWVATKIRLLNLPDETQALVKDKSLSEGHAKQLLKLNTANMGDQVAGLAQEAVKGGWSVGRLQSMVDAVIVTANDIPTPPNPDGRLIKNDQIIQELRRTVMNGGIMLSQVPDLLKRVIREDCWRIRITEQGRLTVKFDRFEDFVVALPLEGMGTTLDKIRMMCRDDPEAWDLLDGVIDCVSRDTQPELCPHCGGTGLVYGTTRMSPLSVSRDTLVEVSNVE